MSRKGIILAGGSGQGLPAPARPVQIPELAAVRRRLAGRVLCAHQNLSTPQDIPPRRGFGKELS